MKIIIYTGTLDLESLSGEVSVAKNDYMSLKNAGHDVHQLNLSGFSKGLLNNILRPIRLFVFPHEVLFIRKKIKSLNPDVIHLHTITPYVSISLLVYLSFLNIPVCQTLHNVRWICVEGAYFRKGSYCNDCSGKSGLFGVINGCNKGFYRSLVLLLTNKILKFNGFIFKSINRFISVSEFVKNEHIANGFPVEKMAVKFNSVNLKNISQNSSVESIRDGIIFVSRMTKSKGTEILKSILTIIKDPMYILGDGPELADLKVYCAENKFDHVHFFGKKDQKFCLNLMSHAFCTLIPSQCGESFSLVAAESMSVGTPIIGSKIGGLDRLISDSGGGIAAQYDDAIEFVAAINQLKNDKVLYKSFSSAGRKFAYQHLNMIKNAENLIEIYIGAINHDNSV